MNDMDDDDDDTDDDDDDSIDLDDVDEGMEVVITDAAVNDCEKNSKIQFCNDIGLDKLILLT